MDVSNRSCIRRLSGKALWADRKRVLISILAIALTALLTTSLFTVLLSINESYQSYTFRQLGGRSQGTFKDVGPEESAALRQHPRVAQAGERTVVGYCDAGPFAKVPGEVSWMEDPVMDWTYCRPTTGRAPESGREIAMDTAALALLGVTPEEGAQVTLTFALNDESGSGPERTDTFTLVGWWDYDELMPVHYLNISRGYCEELRKDAGPVSFRTDLNVMLHRTLDVQSAMEDIEADLGYQDDDPSADGYVRFGVNPGYTAAGIFADPDPTLIVGTAAFLLLVVLTGYLIIYDIFQIAVQEDIRFYGLLKTIGTTPRQIRRIIRHQALLLSLIGIPVGLLAGYGVGALLAPVAVGGLDLGDQAAELSASPLIFLGSALFALATVLFSCARPGRLAGKVSPVEATRYTDARPGRAGTRRGRRAGVCRMALANLGRSRSRTVLVVLSLCLSVVLLNVLAVFVQGFDEERYLEGNTCADFIAGPTGYFRYAPTPLDESDIAEIRAHTTASLSGAVYTLPQRAQCWRPEADVRAQAGARFASEDLTSYLSQCARRDGLLSSDCLVEGLDDALFGKLTVVEGDLAPLFAPDGRSIALAVHTDDYGNVDAGDYPAVGEEITVTYVEEEAFFDRRTGQFSDETTPDEDLELRILRSRDVTYTVCAWVDVPYAMSHRFHVLTGYDLVLPVETLRADSPDAPYPMAYLFDTPDAAAEQQAEAYLADLTEGSTSLMYESKAIVRAEFAQFQHMFLLLGGALCAVVTVVGVLNFFNAIMTGILARRREFAVLQAIGMTGRQLRAMLVWEGLFYALGAVALAALLSLGLLPLIGHALEGSMRFFTYRATVWPILLALPVFAALGAAIPLLLSRATTRSSLVERLREA